MEVIPGSFDDHFKNKSCSQSKVSAFVFKICHPRVNACMLSCSAVSDSAVPRTVAHQALCSRTPQARVLQWAVMPSSRGSSLPRGQRLLPRSPATAGGFFAPGVTWEGPSSPQEYTYVRESNSGKAGSPGNRGYTPTAVSFSYAK